MTEHHVVGSVTATCSAQRQDGYERRQPEQTLLYQVIAEHWSSFRERAEQAGGLPEFVVDEFEAYLRCGILEHGLAHLACSRCGHSMVVAFSCKRRGFCPSCLGRRMSDVAAHLVDEVMPKVPVRQWVCSLPWRLRYAMGYDRRLCADVLAVFIAALRRSLQHRAKRELGLRSVDDAQIGAITFVQRGDSSLRLNVHFHTLALDGVYGRDDAGVLHFHALPTPTPSKSPTSPAGPTRDSPACVSVMVDRSTSSTPMPTPTSSRTTSRHSPRATTRPSVIASCSALRPGNALASSCIRSACSLHPASRSPKSVGSTCTQGRRPCQS